MKTGILITARLKSTRLPMKLLLDLNGKTLVERVIDRCKLVEGVDQIVLCTSPNPQDKPLIEIAQRNGIDYFLGNELDVLQRLSDTSKFFGFSHILSITGENPLFSLVYANRTMKVLSGQKKDFVMFEGLPIGCAVYGLNPKALEVVCQVKKEVDTEIWGPLINRPEIFDVYTEKVGDFYFRPSLRITCDYPEDYQFLQTIFEHYDSTKVPTLQEALQLLDKNPKYLKIHGHKKQASLPPEILKRIDGYYENNFEKIVLIKKYLFEA